MADNQPVEPGRRYVDGSMLLVLGLSIVLTALPAIGHIIVFLTEMKRGTP